MIEGAPVMHGGELLGFVKKVYQQVKLAEVILAYEPGKQIELKTLEEALSRFHGHRKRPPPEATELLDTDSVIVSEALANSIMLPFLKPVMKALIPSELFKPISGTQYIFEVDVPGRDLTLAIEDRLTGIPGLAGEWFVGKVDGIIMRSRKHGTVDVPVKTGMMAQPPLETGECLTIFDFNNGFKTFKTLAQANIPIIYGDVLLADGTLDEKRLLIKAKLVFLMRSREMWVLD
ncbi:MAG: hypothetical protein ACP5PQ_02365 [Thermoproteota archaeon]